MRISSTGKVKSLAKSLSISVLTPPRAVMVLLYSDYVYFSVGGRLPTWGPPPSLKYEFTTSFPVAKYMYKLVFNAF